jgi:hypothetical protein
MRLQKGRKYRYIGHYEPCKNKIYTCLNTYMGLAIFQMIGKTRTSFPISGEMFSSSNFVCWEEVTKKKPKISYWK